MPSTPTPITEAERRLRDLRDPALPALPALLGPAASELLDAALPTPAPLASTRLRRASWRIGKSFVASYERLPSGSDGVDPQVVVARTERRTGDDAGAAVSVWDRSNDPSLPGLRAALEGDDLAAWLDSMGVPPGQLERRVVTYRPGHRAVLDVQRGGHRLFVKVVRPGQTAALAERHRALADLMPAPRVLGHAADAGVVVLQALAGETLAGVLARGGSVDPALILAVLDRVGALPATTSVVASPLERVGEHVRMLSRLLPDEADRLQRLAAAIGPEDRQVDGTIHGDLHEGQLLVRDGAVVGVLDLDTVGRGRVADDPANALAHLASTISSASPAVTSPWLSATLGLADALLRAADGRHDPVDLRRRTAAALLGLGAAQFQSQHPAWPERIRQRIAAAEAWIASAARVRAAAAANPIATMRTSSPAA